MILLMLDTIDDMIGPLIYEGFSFISHHLTDDFDIIFINTDSFISLLFNHLAKTIFII